jgi:D-alanyl-lipoteichoic acid acyltransferase DltB (MBOAT superfamily)
MGDAWITSLSYTFQLYFDFSGYTDMAIGLALLFNITLPQNFNSPYKALNIQDFWRRWHMTLSRFLRDYIYIPLGGNRFGEWNNYRNLFLVFLIGGIWHGASWMFVIWGTLHGVATIVHRLWQKTNIHIPKLLAWFLTFNFINITWIFFRAKDMESAWRVLKGMFFSFDFSTTQLFGLKSVLILLLAFCIVFCLKNSHEKMQTWSPKFAYLAFAFAMFFLSFYYMNSFSEFLYFNF